MIEVTNISKSFGKKQVLDGINFSMESDIYGLIGANGAGKTTLFRCIMGLISVRNGELVIDGKLVSEKNRGRYIGYLPQKFGLYPELTAYEILDYFIRLRRIKVDNEKEEIERCLEMVHLADKQKVQTKKLSGGMIRRLGIAQAMLGKPALILLDEPTVGLDPEERERFRQLIHGMGKQSTILLSTHIIEDVEASCDNAFLLKNGKIEKTDTIDQEQLMHIFEMK